MISTLKEILSTRIWMMQDTAFLNFKQVITANMAGHTKVDEHIHKPQNRMMKFDKQRLGKNFKAVMGFEDDDEKDRKQSPDGGTVTESELQTLVLDATGPLTRYGDFCSSGSVDFRDLMLKYAHDDSVVGMMLLTDGPGGTACALDDFQQGIDVWHQAGKRSIQFIDGMAASAHVAIGCQCQKTIAYHPLNQIGCIGAMMAGYTQKDGDVNAIDQQRFMYVTAEQTPDKNLEFRLAAEGDYTALQNEVNLSAQHFIDTIQRCRPQIPNEMRTGKMYPAYECIGTLIDGIGSMDDAITYLMTGEETWQTNMPNPFGNNQESNNPKKQSNMAEEKCKPKNEETQEETEEQPEGKCKPKNEGEPDEKCKPKDEETPEETEEQPEDKCKPKNSKANGQYSFIKATVGVEELAVKEDGGFYLNGPMAEVIEDALTESAENIELLNANINTVAKLNSRVAELKKANEDLMAQIEKSKEVDESLASEQNKCIQLEQTNQNLNQEIEDLKAQLATKDKQITELAEAQSAAPKPQQPQAQEAKPTDEKPTSIFTSEMTPSERRAAQQARMAALKRG